MKLNTKKKISFKFARLWTVIIFIFLTLTFAFNAFAIDSSKHIFLNKKFTDYEFNKSKNDLLRLSKKELADIDVKVIFAKKSCDIDDKQVSTPTFVLPKSKNEELEFNIFLNITNKTRKTINFARYARFGISNLIKDDQKITPYERYYSAVPATLALEPIKQIEAGKSTNVFLAKGVIFWNNSQEISQRILIFSSIGNNRQIFLQVKPGKYLIEFLYQNTSDLELEMPSNVPFTITEPQLGQQRKPHLIIEYVKKTWIGHFTTAPAMFELIE